MKAASIPNKKINIYVSLKNAKNYNIVYVLKQNEYLPRIDIFQMKNDTLSSGTIVQYVQNNYIDYILKVITI